MISYRAVVNESPRKLGGGENIVLLQPAAVAAIDGHVAPEAVEREYRVEQPVSERLQDFSRQRRQRSLHPGQLFRARRAPGRRAVGTSRDGVPIVVLVKVEDDVDVLLSGPADDLGDAVDVFRRVAERCRLKHRPRDGQPDDIEAGGAKLGEIVLCEPHEAFCLYLAAPASTPHNGGCCHDLLFGGHRPWYMAGSMGRP